MPHRISNWVPLLKNNPHLHGYEIGDYSYGHPRIIRFEDAPQIRIGKFCSIADNVTFMLGGNHQTGWVSTYPFSNYFECLYHCGNIHYVDGDHIKGEVLKGDIDIGNDVWIGQEAFFLSGIKVGDGAIIGARAVVAKDVQPYSIVVGNPARHIRFRFDEATIESLLKMKWWDWPIEKIAEAMPMIMSADLEGFIAKYA